MVEPRKPDQKPKEPAIKPSVEASAARIKSLLGEAGVPIAESMMVLQGAVREGVNEMRSYANGAETAAKEANDAAKSAAQSVETADSKNDAFLEAVKTRVGEMAQKVTLAELAAGKAEEALDTVQKETSEVTLAIRELKATTNSGTEVVGVAALQAISDNAEAIPDTIAKSVDEAVSGKTSNVAKTAGEALGKANAAEKLAADLKGKLDSLSEAVEDAFDSVDSKLKTMMKLLEIAGVKVPDQVKNLINEPSYDNTLGGKNE